MQLTSINKTAQTSIANAQLCKANSLLVVTARVALLTLSLLSFYLARLVYAGAISFQSSWITPLILVTSLTFGCLTLFYATFWPGSAAPLKSSLPSNIQTKKQNLSRTPSSTQSPAKSSKTDIPDVASQRASPQNSSIVESPTSSQQNTFIEPITIFPTTAEEDHSFSQQQTTPLLTTVAAPHLRVLTEDHSIKSMQPTNYQPVTTQSTALNLIEFYTDENTPNTAADPNGSTFTLNDFLKAPVDPNKLDSQMPWLFPVDSASALQQQNTPTPGIVPILDPPAINAFKTTPTLQKQLLRVLHKMLDYSGYELDQVIGHDLEIKADPVIQKSSSYTSKGMGICCDYWGGIPYAFNRSKANTQFARISQILLSLRLLGLEQYSNAFFKILETVKQTDGTHTIIGVIITEEIFQSWRTASGNTL